jgi:hypothetical protein
VRAAGVGGDDSQQRALGAAKLEVADDEMLADGGMLREAASALERDPGLIAAGRADGHAGAGVREDVMDGEQRRGGRLVVPSRDAHADFALWRFEDCASDLELVRFEGFAERGA